MFSCSIPSWPDGLCRLRPRRPVSGLSDRLWLLGLAALLSIWAARAVAAPDTEPALSLDRAERLVLEHYPTLQEQRALLVAARARAVYAGELPDPEINLGVDNVPVDRLGLDQDSMTMTRMGLSQRFPPAGKLALTQQSAEASAVAAAARVENSQAELLRTVRRAWLTLFYQERALDVLQLNREFSDLIVRSALARYRVNQVQEDEVLRAQLARDEFLDEEQALLSQAAEARSRLASLVGLAPARIHLPETLPGLPAVPSEAQLLDAVQEHPESTAARALWRAARLDVAATRREYYPELALSASYGYRLAERNGEKLPDMVSLGLSLSLPLFPERRQDARVQEQTAQALAARYRLEDQVLRLRETVHARYADYTALKRRVDLLDARLLPQAQQAISAALAVYRSNKTDLNNVLRAQQARLDYQLRLWRARTELAAAQSDLLYLTATTGDAE